MISFPTDKGNKLAEIVCKKLGNQFLYEDLEKALDCGMELDGSEEDDYYYIAEFLDLEDNKDYGKEANGIKEAKMEIAYLKKVRRLKSELREIWEKM